VASSKLNPEEDVVTETEFELKLLREERLVAAV
jgi:hypothetical protein